MPGLGFLAVSAAAVIWAVSATYGRTLIDRGALPLEISMARAWVAFLAFGIWTLLRDKPRKRVPVWIALVFGLSIAGANYFYYTAIATLPVAIAVVIQYTAPALVVLWLALADRRRPSRRLLVAIAATIAGVALLSELIEVVSGAGISLDATGVAAAAASAVAFASYIVTGERIERAAGPAGALAWGFGVASVLWAVVLAVRGSLQTLTDGSLLPGVLLLSVIATVIPFALFVWGLARIGASRAGVVSTLEPLSAAVVAYLWLEQALDGVQIAGAALVLAGVAVVQSSREEAVPTPAPVD